MVFDSNTRYYNFVSGAIAGTITVYCTMPLDVVKTKLQSLQGSEYRNVFYGMYKVSKEEGLTSLWKGATPRLSRLIFSGGIVFTVYETVLQVSDMFSTT